MARFVSAFLLLDISCSQSPYIRRGCLDSLTINFILTDGTENLLLHIVLLKSNCCGLSRTPTTCFNPLDPTQVISRHIDVIYYVGLAHIYWNFQCVLDIFGCVGFLLYICLQETIVFGVR